MAASVLRKCQTDWERVDRMTEPDLDEAIAADPDDPGNDPS